MSRALVPIPLESGDIHVDADHVSTVYLGGTGDTVVRYKDGDYQTLPGDVVAQVVSVVNADRAAAPAPAQQYPHPGKD